MEINKYKCLLFLIILSLLFGLSCRQDNLNSPFFHSNMKGLEMNYKEISYEQHTFKGVQMYVKGWTHTISFDSGAVLIKGDLFIHQDTIFLKERNMVSPFIIWNKPESEITDYLKMIIPYRSTIDDYKDVYECPEVYKVVRLPIKVMNNDTVQYLKIQINNHRSSLLPYLGMRISKSRGIEGMFLCDEDFTYNKSAAVNTAIIFYPHGSILERDTNLLIGYPSFE